MQVFENNSDIFQILSEGVSEGILVVDTTQQIVAANSAANNMFGYDKGELLGKPLSTLIPLRFKNAHSKQVAGFIAKSEKRQMGRGRELFGRRKNDEEFPLEAGLNPFELHGATYVMALVIETTERKKREKELQHWANIFKDSLNEIYIIDRESLLFRDVNKAARENLGYDLEMLQGMTPVDLKPDYDIGGFRELIQPLTRGETDSIEFESSHKRKDGSSYPVEVHLHLSDREDSQVLVAMILDITDRKNYTERLEQTVQQRTRELREALEKEKELNELKTRFLSLVSHEFKTPLSSILTSVTLLSKYTQSEQQEKRDRHIATIRNKVKYLDTILNDFLSVERLESGKEHYRLKDFPLSKLVNEVVYNANMMLKEGQRIHYPDRIDDLVLNFDEKTLELVLSNLIHNAIKYSPEDTVIKILVERRKEGIFIRVADQGIGIPEKDQKHIFERYFRAENALLSEGTGIGLNIAKQHLENLGAALEFQSVENKGSTFSIWIPGKRIHANNEENPTDRR